jgi:hypothetical protein
MVNSQMVQKASSDLKKKPYPIELVCHGCGGAQPEEEA